MLDKIFLQILNMSFTASFVILFVLIARLLLKRLPKVFSYALWGVVLFRLVFPFSFESIFSLLPAKANPISQDIVYAAVPAIDTGIPAINHTVNPLLSAATPYASVNPLQIWVFIGSIIWILGIAALLVYSIISLLKLQKRLKRAVHERENIFLAEQLDTPFVMGIVHPKIYLPATLADEEKQYILLHEQVHIRRLDHVVKILSFFVLCLHWFNPLVWVAFFVSAKDMEMSCDEAVIKQLGNDIKKGYSSSLLILATGRRIIGGTPLAFGEGDTKGRIKNVLHYKKPAFWVALVTVVVVICIAVGLMTNPKDEKTGFGGVNAIILEIDKDNQTMTVKGIDENSVIGDKCVLTWEGEPFITVATNSEPKPISLDDFFVGDYVVLFIGEVQESYPTKATATTIQLKPKENRTYSAEDLWSARTQYVGDNSAVGKIVMALSLPGNLKYDGFELFTKEHPYAVSVNLKTDTETRNAYTGVLNEVPFQRNAIIMFSLIENVERIIFTLDDGQNPYSVDYTRDWAEYLMGGSLYKRTETYEGFGKLAKEISIKISNKIEDDIKHQQPWAAPENTSFFVKPDEPAEVIANTAAEVWLKSLTGNNVPVENRIAAYEIVGVSVVVGEPRTGEKREDMKYHYVVRVNYNITTATERYYFPADGASGKGTFKGLFRELCVKALSNGQFEIVHIGTSGSEQIFAPPNYSQSLTTDELKQTEKITENYFTNEAPYYEGVVSIHVASNDYDLYRNHGIVGHRNCDRCNQTLRQTQRQKPEYAYADGRDLQGHKAA